LIKVKGFLFLLNTYLKIVKHYLFFLNITDDINATKYEERINALRDKINTYNTELSVLDEQLAVIQDLEEALAEFSDRVLSGVAAKYGRDSDEYLKVGGTKKSDRKRPTRKILTTP
jgi:uncharacterized protein YqgV (UPF0045/DUF77 family)